MIDTIIENRYKTPREKLLPYMEDGFQSCGACHGDFGKKAKVTGCHDCGNYKNLYSLRKIIYLDETDEKLAQIEEENKELEKLLQQSDLEAEEKETLRILLRKVSVKKIETEEDLPKEHHINILVCGRCNGTNIGEIGRKNAETISEKVMKDVKERLAQKNSVT